MNEIFNKYNKNLPEIDNLDDIGLQTLIQDEPLWDKLGTTKERRKELKTRIKRKVREIAKEMNFSDIEGTDLKTFFDKVQIELKKEIPKMVKKN